MPWLCLAVGLSVAQHTVATLMRFLVDCFESFVVGAFGLVLYFFPYLVVVSCQLISKAE